MTGGRGELIFGLEFGVGGWGYQVTRFCYDDTMYVWEKLCCGFKCEYICVYITRSLIGSLMVFPFPGPYW